MKASSFLFLAIACLILFSSCNKDEEAFSYESYRYELWKKLKDNNYQFDFVGTQTEMGTYPQYMGEDFDLDHEGIGGIETDGVLNNLEEVLSNIPTPDVVLLGIGGNDLFDGEEAPQEPIENINQIIDRLQLENPNLLIALEQIAPASPEEMTPELTSAIETFNELILTVADNQTDNNSKVIAIDMYTDFSTDYLADEVHYNEEGAEFIAANYFNLIQNEIPNTTFINILPIGDSRVQGNRM